MGPFDNMLVWSLNRYFETLEHTGYIREADTNKLIVLSFIEEFLEEFQGYITEDDYKTISDIITCFANSSCLIPYREFKQLNIPLNNYIYNIPIRVSETENNYNYIRHTEVESALRLVNL